MISNLPFPCKVTRHTRRFVPPFFRNAVREQGRLESKLLHTKIDGKEVACLLSCGPTKDERWNHWLLYMASVNITCECHWRVGKLCASWRAPVERKPKPQPGPSHGATRLVIHPAKGEREGLSMAAGRGIPRFISPTPNPF